MSHIFSYIEEITRKMFDIREGERLRVFLMTLYIFLVVSSLMIIKSTSTSLFLSKFTVSKLPNVFILVAVFAALVASLYSILLKRIPLIRLIVKTLQIAIASLLIFTIFLSVNFLESWTLYVFYVWSAIFALISSSQFWILANIMFNSREVKRLIGFIGSGAIGGGIFGGYLTKFLAPHMGSGNLIYICVLFLTACILITRSLATKTSQDENLQRFRQQQQTETVTDSPLTLIMNSRHLTLLACILGVSVIVGKLVEYQFSAIASAKITEEDQLTAFFGFWFSNLNIASLFIQLFVTRRIVGLFGVGVSLFFLPMGILMGAMVILFHPSLWSAILIKMFDGSLKNSINKAGIELLTLPIPASIKTQAKMFIDVFVDSFATGLGGLLLILVTSALGFTLQKVSLIIILFICLWIYLINRVRFEYIISFRLKLEDTPSPISKADLDLKSESILGELIKILQGEDSSQILKALRMVKEIQNDRLAPCFNKLIHHPLNAVRLEALKHLYYYRNLDFTEDVKPFVSDPDQDIKTEAIHYLFGHTRGDRISMLLRYLEHEDYSIKRAALVAAARESRSNPKLAKTLNIKEKVEENLKNFIRIKDEREAVFTKINSARVIGAANIPELHPYLHILLNDPSSDVLQAAILGAGESRQNEFIPILIRFLGVKEFQNSSIKALTGFSPQIIDILNDHLKNPFVEREIRLSIPSVISSLGTQKSVNVLIQHLDQNDPAVRYEVIKALNRLRADFPDLKFESQKVVNRIMDEARDYLDILSALYAQAHTNSQSKNHQNPLPCDEIKNAREMLIKELEERLDHNLERIFRLLGLKYPPQEIYDAYLGIQSRKPDLRVNAVEYLDGVLETNLRKAIIPIIETSIVDTMIDQTVDRLGLKIPSEFEGFFLLLSREDTSLQVSALNLIALMKDERYVPFISKLVNHSDQSVRDMARFALKNLGIPL